MLMASRLEACTEAYSVHCAVDTTRFWDTGGLGVVLIGHGELSFVLELSNH